LKNRSQEHRTEKKTTSVS